MAMQSRSVRGNIAGLLATPLLILMLAGCAENRSTFFIRDTRVPDENGIITPASPYITRGLMDVALTTGYVLSVDLVNQSMNRTERMPLYLNNTGINVEGAEVELHQDSPEGPVIDIGGGQTTFTVYSGAFVQSASSSTPGEAIGSFQIIPPSLGVSLYDQLGMLAVPSIAIVAGVRVFGHNTAGYVEETQQYFWPIDVCFLCSVIFPIEADDPELAGSHCDSTEAPTKTSPVIGQDGPTDCRLCVRYPDPTGVYCRAEF